jgi:hypothetical protein
VLLVLIGAAIVAIPIAIALRTVLRLTRGLGSVDASLISELLEEDPSVDLDHLRALLVARAPRSLARRLIDAVLEDEEGKPRSPLARRLALAEVVADVERDVVDDLRVPRVAASLATTGGLLAAALVMREGLGATLPEGTDPVPYFSGVIERGLTVAAIAVLGGVVCASLHRIAQRERRHRLSELDALVAPLNRRLE